MHYRLKKKYIDNKTLRKLHEANLSGVTLSQLAKTYNFSFRQMSDRLAGWRKINNRPEPMSTAQFKARLSKAAKAISYGYNNNIFSKNKSKGEHDII